MQNLVTRDSLMQLLQKEEIRQHVIGRALVALLHRQTRDEAVHNTTSTLNSIGFMSCDARSGSIAAKTYIKRKSLLDFQIEYWMQPGKNGYPRICRYARQLNEVAIEKRN